MTLSPTDVSVRVSSYVESVPIEESYHAMCRALARMTPADLAQVAIAFDVPVSRGAETSKQIFFDEGEQQTGVLSHFLTVPNGFKARLERFLCSHPRALACFEDADASRILQLSVPAVGRPAPSTASRRYFNMMAAIVIFAGFSLGALLALVAHQRHKASIETVAARPVERNPATPSPIASATENARNASVLAPASAAPSMHPAMAPSQRIVALTPRAAVTSSPVPQASLAPSAEQLQGAWLVSEANSRVGSIVWVGGATVQGNSLALDLHKASVGGRSAMPCERQTNLRTVITASVAQTVPYRETNCQGFASTGELRVDRFSDRRQAFQGSFWQNGVKLGNFKARKP